MRELRLTIAVTTGLIVLLTDAAPLRAQSLKGSSWSLTVQNEQARVHDFTYLSNRSHVDRFLETGLLVPVRGNGAYRLHRVSYPYARPEVKLFIERLAEQYRAACGEPLIVTSLLRPESMRLWNSSSRSVHPTGMALDLRASDRASCRRWLEGTLLDLEAAGVVEATRERRPPHYHVAVFPRAYEHHLAALGIDAGVARAHLAAATESESESDITIAEAPEPLQASLVPYQVMRGETLWNIARELGTTVTDLMDLNELTSPTILAGQVLRVPAAERALASVTPRQQPAGHTYRVSRGDNLWTIARRHGTTITEIKRVNGLRTSRIQPGQVLEIPVAAR